MLSDAKISPAQRQALNYFLLLSVSSCLSTFLFMRNPWMASDLNTDSYVWFLEFSRSIFQPQSAYYAESILLPLFARILGATQSIVTYKLLCALLTLLILPITTIIAQRYFQNIYKTLLFVFLFGFSFSYLQYYILGFPDPLTILLLVLAVFQKRLGVKFIFLALAMLSHFSMATLGAIGLAGMYVLTPNSLNQFGRKSALTVLAAIVAGKALLLSWYAIFHYQLVSRIDWALAKGYGFFLDRYEENILGFWLTPGILFLLVYLFICTYFLFQKRFAFAASMLLALVLSYIALFWTVDGLRVFAAIIAAPFAYMLQCFINSLSFLGQAK